MVVVWTPPVSSPRPAVVDAAVIINFRRHLSPSEVSRVSRVCVRAHKRRATIEAPHIFSEILQFRSLIPLPPNTDLEGKEKLVPP